MPTKTQTYTIYKITDGRDVYVGMTTNALSTRFRQHKNDAEAKDCKLTAKLCKKTLPSDIKALHRRLRDNSTRYRIQEIKKVTGTYAKAHREELALKAKHATLK